jgi:hypothetical protein
VFDVKELLARQAEWQKARRLLSWPEKLRQAAEMRETLRHFEILRASEAGKRRHGAVSRPHRGESR